MLCLSLYSLFILSFFFLFTLPINPKQFICAVKFIPFFYLVHSYYYSEAYSLTLSRHDTFSRRGVDKPKAGGSPPVGFPRLLILYIRSYHPYWRQFLHQQLGGAPCRGEWGSLIAKEIEMKTLKVR